MGCRFGRDERIFFGLTSNGKYFNPQKRFSSYFLSFHTGARIEIMHRPDISKMIENKKDEFGFTHFAISVGSKEEVNQLTESIRSHGYTVQGEPRTSGDGYYESVILDPEGNIIEITE